MQIKEYIKEVSKRLDSKSSWGINQVKELLLQVAVELYEQETKAKEIAHGQNKEDDTK